MKKEMLYQFDTASSFLGGSRTIHSTSPGAYIRDFEHQNQKNEQDDKPMVPFQRSLVLPLQRPN